MIYCRNNFQMNIADSTGSCWVTAFSEDAEKVLGMPAQVGGLKGKR